MPTINNLRKWKNGEIFNARDYVYERDVLVSQVNRLSALLGDSEGTADLDVSTITVGGRTLSYDETHGTLELGLLNDVKLHLGQEQYFYAKAKQTNITIGQPIMFAGVEGNHFLIQEATPEALNANPEYFIGIAAQNIATGEFGYVIEFGHLDGVNLPEVDYQPGDVLWFDSTNGGFTKTKPPRGKAQIRIAAVIAVNQNENQTFTGEMFIRPSILEAASTSGILYETLPADAQVDDLFISYD